MEYSIKYDDVGNYFVIETEGDFNLDHFGKLADDLLNHNKWVPGTNCLFDYRKTSLFSMSNSDITKAAQMHINSNSKIGNGKSAFVVMNIGNTGMSRMYEASTCVDTTFSHFIDIDKARKWLTD